MKATTLPLAIIITQLLYGCTANKTATNEYCFDDSGQVVECLDEQQRAALNPVSPMSEYQPNKVKDPSLFTTNIHFQLLSEYVEQMALNLKHASTHAIGNNPVAITSFVNLDSTLKSTSVLGNQISEYFINELQNTGFLISDYKVTGGIEVMPSGDLAMSRQVKELNKNLNINYVLTGTLITNERGVVVSARIVSITNNHVIASTSKLLPNLIVEGLL